MENYAKKVPPILKPIALLTISTIIATATGVVNSSSYRQSNGTSHSTEITETTEKPAMLVTRNR